MIRKIFDIVRRLWSIQFFRFLVVGGVNTLFGYTVFAVLILVHVNYILAALGGQICGTLFNFKTTGTMVFKNKNNRLIYRFIGVYILTYLINISFLKIFNSHGISNLIAGAIIILPVASLSFCLNKIFVFRSTFSDRDVNFTPYLVYALLSFAILGSLLLPGFILTLDSPYALVQNPRPLFYGLNEHWISAGMPFYSLVDTISKVLPVWFLEKLILLSILFLAGLGAHRLFSRWGKVGSYFAGIFYMINPFSYVRFVTGQWDVLSAYALIPFAVKSFLELLEHPNLKKAIELTVLSTLVGIIEVQGLFLLFLALTVILLLKILTQRAEITNVGKYIGISATLFLFLNAYWLVPTLTAGKTILQEISKADMTLFTPSPISGGRLMLDLATLHGFWRGGYIYISDLTPIWLILFGFILFLACYGFVCKYEDKEKRWFIISIASIGVAGFVLAAGAANSITMPIFQWLWDNVFFFRGFRDSQKFIGLLCLSYSILGGFGVNQFVSIFKQQKWWFPKATLAMVIVLSIIVPLAYSLPMFGSYGQLRTVYPPKEWDEVNEYLKSDSSDFNVLFLPWHLYMDFTWLSNRDKRLTNLGERFFSKPIIQGDNIDLPGLYSESTNQVSKYVEFLMSNGNGVDNLGELLAPLNVKYVILVDEADYKSYGFLYRQNDLTVVSQRPGITLLKNEHITTRVYAVNSVIHINNLEEYLEYSKTQDVMEHVYVMNNVSNYDAEVQMEKLVSVEESLIKYKVQGSLSKYTIFTIPQNTNWLKWELNGENPVFFNLGFIPTFTSSAEGGEITYSRFYRVYLPSYIISILTLTSMVYFYFRLTKP